VKQDLKLGPTLMQLSRSGAMTPAQTGAILASLYMSVHKTPPPPDVLFLRDWLAALQLSGGIVPKHIATGVLTLIERLRPGDGLCHADLHPGNVIMTADGPRLVDWTGAVRAPAAFDLACGHIVLIELAPEFIDDPQRPARLQCGRAVRVRAAGRHASSGADGGDGALPADRLRHPTPLGRAGRSAGAADPAHRSGPAFGGLKRSALSAGIDGAGPSSVSALGRFRRIQRGPSTG
jgi:hypothetical protein